MALQHLRASTANKRPTPAAMADGQLAVNTAATSPGLFFKDAGGALVKVGPVHVGTTAPNATPASGGQAGNSIGEQWLDTSNSRFVFKVWDGTAWRTEDGEFVNASGDVMTGALGIIAGSATAPGLYFSGDTNTGIYSPGADQVAISTNGTGRLFVRSTGEIENASTVNWNFASLALKRNSSNLSSAKFISFLLDGDTVNNTSLTAYGNIWGTFDSAPTTSSTFSGLNGILNFGGPNALAFHTNASERMRLDSTGRLGLGTSSPDSNLHVASGGNTFLKISTSFASPSTGLYIDTAGDASTPGVFFQKSSSTRGSILYKHNATAASETLEFNVAGGSSDLVINGAGNVGIGTTGPTRKLVVSSSEDTAIQSVSTGTGSYIQFVDANNSSYIGTNNGSLLFLNPTTERARIDSSGRLLVGTTTATNGPIYALDTGTGRDISGELSATNGFGFRFVTYKARGSTGSKSVVADNDELGNIIFNGYGGSSFHVGASIQALVDGTPGANDMPGRLVFSTTADGASSPTERMRITSAGAVLIGKQALSPTTTGVEVEASGFMRCVRDGNVASIFQRYTSDGDVVGFRRDNTTVGSISITTSATAYNTSSDYRLKENVVPLTGAIDRLQQIPVHRFNFIADPDKTVDGFIAHEAQEIVPECVTGTKDAVDDDGNPVYQGIDQSKLVPLLTAALQQAIAEIASLKDRVAALEAS
jgi:hypothetical protein